ncbi:MAG: YciI family protein [Deltaproteobacteria bacterium]
MQYLLLIYEAEAAFADRTDDESKTILDGYFAFTDDLKKSGAFISSEALQPVETARSLQKRDGKLITTDGPFAETKEQLGGFYLLEAENMDEALALAARIPTVETGTIEVRPIWNVEAGR